MPHNDCTRVTTECPVEATIYGYYPNLGANAFFCAWFVVFTLITVVLAWRTRVWNYSRLLVVGNLCECLGYVGRLILHGNPWSNPGFEMQICCLIFSPSFYAAAIYLTLKHIALEIGPQFSPIPAALYPWLFITFDFLSLVLQAAGGGTAAAAGSSSPSMALTGANIMLTGIVFQVATFTLLYILVSIFCFNVYRARHTLSASSSATLSSKDFKIFVTCIGLASLFVYVRCIYRIAELEGGWASSVMRDENGFIVLDGVMCALAALFLALGHPGFWFGRMVDEERDWLGRRRGRGEEKVERDGGE